MATLKDLAPAEKQKVARLIKQAVEREAAIRELEAGLGEARAAAAAAAEGTDAAGRAAALEEQNRGLALENTSLRAKLSHAFDLLRTYQHKVRVLDATVGVAGAASLHPSRPITPAGPLVALGTGGTDAPAALDQGVDPQLLATQLRALEGGAGSSHCSVAALCTPQRGGRAGQCAAAAAPCCSSGQLSPVAEDAAEGASPAQVPPTASAPAWRAPGGPHQAAEGGIQLVPPGAAALPQLETLKMLAQALLEAQAEVAAKQRRRGAAVLGAPGHLPAPAPAPQQQELAGAVPPPAQLVFDASLGPCGGFLISPQPAPSGCSEQRGSSSTCSAQAPDAEPVHVGALSSTASGAGEVQRAPLSAWQHQHQHQHQQQQEQQQQLSPCGSSHGDSGCSSSLQGAGGGGAAWASGSSRWASGPRLGCSSRPLDFGDDLLALVQDVENIAGRHEERGRSGSGHSGGTWHGPSGSPLYEENDVMLLL